MSTSLARRRNNKVPPENLRLRRLTQAYLTPYQRSKPAQTTVVSQIDRVYSITQDLILNYQSVTSGLFPRYSKNQDVGYVKDSIYCALACWACSVAYNYFTFYFCKKIPLSIERTYRTPDFGMWERGTRYNNGKPELHASSLGMVIWGYIFLNIFLFIYYLLVFSLLFKNTDAALLMTIGWPAFATHDQALFEKTVQKCIRRLEGKYGVRRFLRDGYHSELEDNTRTFYEEHETSRFHGIECQFPMFFAYISLTVVYIKICSFLLFVSFRYYLNHFYILFILVAGGFVEPVQIWPSWRMVKVCYHHNNFINYIYYGSQLNIFVGTKIILAYDRENVKYQILYDFIETVREHLERVYRRACQLRLWWLVRYCAGKLRKAMNSLAPAITNMLLVDLFFAYCPENEPHVAVMHQELIIACSDLLLCIIATILERNPEISFTAGRIDCDCAVVEFILSDRHFSQVINIFGDGEKNTPLTVQSLIQLIEFMDLYPYHIDCSSYH
uniref:Phosphorylase b kinase regulatory subunit n=1 Tax=Heterorhabditis bacteriophora TaxID=37862 RepID=A0A1I7WF09_HETBA